MDLQRHDWVDDRARGTLPKTAYTSAYTTAHANFCLDLCLAAQGDSFEEAQAKLDSMICTYVEDATVGEDRDFGADLLRRPAPLRD
jgi:hypothetical protein